ncbi:hypothetical protein J8L85_16140 [Maribacter sp. MMG018]|uniref:hypothetical protein n=1 Tax=Maribacter sp. MMG018 TaxID=2822688 RepID=UPI001B392750|nr:hypothetical protein [Maribacter sp. MMG018]MBQ4915985.1 hypothetical protein [Maribacter sp. MMG018]
MRFVIIKRGVRFGGLCLPVLFLLIGCSIAASKSLTPNKNYGYWGTIEKTDVIFQRNEDLKEVGDNLRGIGLKNIREDMLKAYWFMIRQKMNTSELLIIEDLPDSKIEEIQHIVNMVNLHSDVTLNDKKILGNEYPKGFFFRTPDYVDMSYEDWEKENRRLGGVFVKAMSEEISTKDVSRTLTYLNRFAIENPEQLVVLHFNGRSRDPNWNTSKYSAGHWLYNPGCFLERDISSNDSILKVSDTSVFRLNIGLRNAKKKDDIVLVPIDKNGEKIWERAEQVTLVAIGDGDIKVARGQYGTKPLSFEKGKTYVAPHATSGPWGSPKDNNLLWYYNLSSTCPKDLDGKQCADILVEEIGSWFENDGVAFALDGIQFDISPWTLKKVTSGKRKVDLDLDGVADDGYLDGKNVFGMGVYSFYKNLRKTLGNTKLILGDGGVDYSMRAIGVANGMEAEGFCQPNNSFREFSKPLSLFGYWNKYAITPSFSYITNKDKNGSEKDQKDRERMVLAAAQCLGVSFNSVIGTPSDDGFKRGIVDELVKGEENEQYWLGKPLGPTIYDGASLNKKDVLDFNGVKINSVDCQFKIKNNELIMFSHANVADKNMKVVLKDLNFSKGDVVIDFKAKSKEPLVGFESFVPRQIVVGTDAVINKDNTAPSILNYINSVDELACSFYFREVGQRGDLEIEIEGGGEVVIKDFKITNRQLAMAREFENGVVLVNASLKPYTFDLVKLFPGSRFKRLKGTKLQNIDINNGEEVDRTVTTEGLSGLFLMKI